MPSITLPSYVDSSHARGRKPTNMRKCCRLTKVFFFTWSIGRASRHDVGLLKCGHGCYSKAHKTWWGGLKTIAKPWFPLTLKGHMVSIYCHTHLYMPRRVYTFYIYGLETLFSTFSYVKERIETYSYLTLIIKIQLMYLDPRTPNLRVWTKIYNNIEVVNQPKSILQC